MRRAILGITACLFVALSGATAYAQETAKSQIITVEKSPFLEAYIDIGPAQFDVNYRKQPTKLGELKMGFLDVAYDDYISGNMPLVVAWGKFEIIVANPTEQQTGMTISYTRKPSVQYVSKVTVTVPTKAAKQRWVQVVKIKYSQYTARFWKIRRNFDSKLAASEAKRKKREERLRKLREGPILVYPK